MCHFFIFKDHVKYHSVARDQSQSKDVVMQEWFMLFLFTDKSRWLLQIKRKFLGLGKCNQQNSKDFDMYSRSSHTALSTKLSRALSRDQLTSAKKTTTSNATEEENTSNNFNRSGNSNSDSDDGTDSNRCSNNIDYSDDKNISEDPVTSSL